MAAIGGRAAGQEAGPPEPAPPTPDKSTYHLFNPTPRSLMREMSTDRPDTTESPYTVDAGHLQIEMSFFDWTSDRRDGEETRTWALAPVNLKLGLLNSTDIQFVLDGYLFQSVEGSAGGDDEVSGFGDFTVRLKQNLWGNDGGDTALGIMPFITFPTGKDEFTSGKIEGGLIIPAAFSLPNDFSLGAMVEFDFVRSSDDSRYVVDLVYSATVSHALVGDLGGYAELVGISNLNGDESFRALFDAGLTYALSADLVLDAGIRVGLTSAAEDFGVFVGGSVRF